MESVQKKIPAFDPLQDGVPLPRGAVRLEKEIVKNGRYCPPQPARVVVSSYDEKVSMVLTCRDYEKKVAIAVSVNDARLLGHIMLLRFIGNNVVHEEKIVFREGSFDLTRDMPCGFPCVFAFEITQEIAWWDQILHEPEESLPGLP